MHTLLMITFNLLSFRYIPASAGAGIWVLIFMVLLLKKCACFWNCLW